MKANGLESGRTWWNGCKEQKIQDFLSSSASANHPMTTSWKWIWTKKVEVHDEMVSQGTCNIFMELIVSNTVYKVSKFFHRESQRTWRMDLINVMWLMKLSASFLGSRFCISPDMVWRVPWQHDHSTYEGQWSRKWKDVMRWSAEAKYTGFLILFCISWPSHDYFLKVEGHDEMVSQGTKDGHWSSKRSSWNGHSKNLQHFVSFHENFCRNILMEFW